MREDQVVFFGICGVLSVFAYLFGFAICCWGQHEYYNEVYVFDAAKAIQSANGLV